MIVSKGTDGTKIYAGKKMHFNPWDGKAKHFDLND